jgi:hypothetical protein
VNKYQIATRVDGTGFDVHVVTSSGVRQTLLGFVTEPEAQAWIAQDQRLSRAANPLGVRGERVGVSLMTHPASHAEPTDSLGLHDAIA